MSDLMLMRILAALLRCQPATFDVVREAAGIGNHTARDALARLQKRNLVQAAVMPNVIGEPTVMGRPPTIYSLTPEGWKLAPFMRAALDRLQDAVHGERAHG